MRVKVLVLSGFGINCEAETRRAFQLAGADAAVMHLGDLIDSPEYLRDFHIFAVPGGFSFGDDVASGKILANRLRYRLGDEIQDFVRAGKLIIGICNGFQVLVKLGVLPRSGDDLEQVVTLTHNDSGRFEDRWVHLAVEPSTVCVWLRGIQRIELPVRHGEGKFVVRDEAVLHQLAPTGRIALRYARANGTPADGEYPANPNGSMGDIAGICDVTGRVFGLMPHPECYLDGTNHPRWTREGLTSEGAGLQIFRNAVAFAAHQFARASARR